MVLLDIFSDAGFSGMLVVMILIVIGVFLLPFIFYLITLQNTLKAIKPEHRSMEPGMVWLMFIPLFNIVWQFIVVIRISESIQRELIAREQPAQDKPAYSPGMAYCILSLLGWIPLLGALCSIAALVCWIIHWVKVNEYKNQFLSEPYQASNDSQIFGHV
jgi:hypothetical protein